MLSITIPSDSHQLCYFTISPPAHTHDHFSTETRWYSPALSPIDTPSDPANPLLAYREPQMLSTPSSPATKASSSCLQMQTAAAHGHSPSRPRPSPVQNVLHVTSSEDSDSSDSSSSIDSSKSSLDVARCSRCQRTPGTDFRTGKSNMIQYGLNLWYCNRCASMVGLSNR